MVAVSLLLWPVADTGPVYAVAAAVLGAGFLRRGAPSCSCGRARSRRPPARGRAPMRLFHGSITYLTLLFVAIAIDPLLPF